MTQKLVVLAFIYLTLGILFAPLTPAKIGYDIYASVNSSSWSADRSTQNLDFSMTGSVSGHGSFTKLTHIQKSAGIESHELSSSSSSKGYLKYDEQMRLGSFEGPVTIKAEIKGEVDELTNESLNVSGEEYINIEVDERWPTNFANYKKINYLGPGIRTRESYQNNGDVVATSINSWKLTKESVYTAHINRSVTSVNITSNDVVETTRANKTSHYGMSLETVGELTNLDIIRLGESRDPFLRITQDYSGEQNMTLNIDMSDYVPPSEEETDWLECCTTDEAEMAQKCSLTPSMDQFFFTPTP